MICARSSLVCKGICDGRGSGMCASDCGSRFAKTSAARRADCFTGRERDAWMSVESSVSSVASLVKVDLVPFFFSSQFHRRAGRVATCAFWAQIYEGGGRASVTHRDIELKTSLKQLSNARLPAFTVPTKFLQALL